MVEINFRNENGNVAVKVRDNLRKQALAKVLDVLVASEDLEGVVANANGGVSVPLAIDKATGETIYAHFEMTVSTKAPTDKKERKKKSKAKETKEVEIPDLFASEIELENDND